jgi:hypothetical protein
MYSDSGTTWNPSNAIHTANWNYVCYGNGKFVALTTTNNTGVARLMVALDGVAWNPTDLTTGTWAHVCYGRRMFVAVGSTNGDKIRISQDGAVWTGITLPSPLSTYSYTNVCYVEHLRLFVATGMLPSFRTIVITSPNGMDWKEESIPNLSPFMNWHLCSAPNKNLLAAFSFNDTSGYSGNTQVMTTSGFSDIKHKLVAVETKAI